MATIQDFKSQITQGGARPNQFRVVLTFPTWVQTGIPAANAAQFLANSTSLPSSNLGDIPLAYRGRPVHFAGERTFEPWNINVINETDFLIRNSLENWMNGIVNLNATNGLVAPGNYQTDLVVSQLDRNDAVLKTYTLKDAYPVAVGGIELSFENNSSIEQFPVTFEFNYYTTTF